MAKVIKFWTSHPNKTPEYWKWWFGLPELEFCYTKSNPDYLFASEHIYLDNREMRAFLSFRGGVRIFIGGEAISPDFNLFDYACSFDRGLSLNDRAIRKPPILFFNQHVFTPLTNGCNDPEEELKLKKGFCNFIYSNPKAHPRRDELYHAISEYKHVDSLGPHLNNVGTSGSRTAQDWRHGLVEMKRPYKFSIASENATFDGYVTEKLISSFQAHTIPIYWGDPSIAEEFNPKAFINANGLTDSELLQIVHDIDNDDGHWCDMIRQPAITGEQSAALRTETDIFTSFFRKVFDDRPIESKKRAPAGYWNDIYRQSLTRRTKFFIF